MGVQIYTDSFAKAIRSSLRFLTGSPLSDWRWSYWLVIAIQVTVAGLIFRAWIGPWALRALLRRVRVSSISPRSVRGIRIRTRRMTLRLDRLGLSYHRPSVETARRFSVQVQGLYIEFHKVETKEPSPQRSGSISTPSRRFSRKLSLTDFTPSPLWYGFWSCYSYLYTALEPHIRPLVRAFFVTSTRIVIRLLPTLTHIIDLELDRLLVSFPGFPEAHLSIRSATLSTTVSFTHLESFIAVESPETRAEHVRQRFLNMAHFRSRFGGSVKRVWDRAWGHTQGAATIELRIGTIASFADRAKWVYPPATRLSDQESSAQIAASRFDFVSSRQHNDALCFGLPDTTSLLTSFKFGPKRGILEKYSVETNLNVSRVNISAEILRDILHTLKDDEVSEDPSAPNLPSWSDEILAASPKTEFPAKVMDCRRRKLTNRISMNLQISLFRSSTFRIKNISIHFLPWYGRKPSTRRYTAYVKDLQWSVELSHPSKNRLHREHLGRNTQGDVNSEIPVYSLSMAIREIMIQRHDIVDERAFMRIISIGRVGLQCLTTQWTLPFMPLPENMPRDALASLLVVQLDISAPQFCERLDVVGTMLSELRLAKPEKIRRPTRHVLNFVPRLVLELTVRDIAACFILVDHQDNPTTSVILSSTQASVSAQTSFKSFPTDKPKFPDCASDGYSAIEMEIEAHSVLGPAFVTFLSHPFELDASERVARYVEAPSIFGEPLISLSTLEAHVSGSILGGIFGDTEAVSLDIGSTLLDIKCSTEAVAIELWQPAALSMLNDLVDFVNNLPKSPAIEGDGGAVLTDHLPFTISMYLGVGQMAVMVTGRDVNPSETLGISRGIAVRSGISFQVCSFRGRGHFARLRRHFSLARARQKLSLPEDLMTEAIALASTQKIEEGRTNLLRVRAWDTAIRTSVATEFAADRAYDASKDADELRSSEFLWMHQLQLDILTRVEVFNKDSTRQRTQLIVKIPYLQTRLELLQAYCLLLTMTTFKSLLNHGRKDIAKIDSKDITTFKISMDTVQALVVFPLQERLCLRCNNLAARVAQKDPVSGNLGTLFLWIPSPRTPGKWEEIARFRAWNATVTTFGGTVPTVVVNGEGARLRIPYNYVIADLILDISVAFKAFRHLSETVSYGKYFAMNIPGAEGAKVIQTIRLTVECISVEAADDPLESKLGLIWKCGTDAAATRQERDEAFDAKVTAILAADNLNTSSLPTARSDNRFSAHHSVSVEEARERLLQVHAISWSSLHRECRERQRRKEDRIRRQIRGDHAQFSGIDIPTLVDVYPSSNSPPLARIILSGVSLNITQPLFRNGNLSDFLFDLGKGLPRNTRFTLLIPLHLNLATRSARVTLRDYPLPLLNIPESEGQKVAWVFETDLVIAEEIGTLSSVLWKECLIVPAGTGSSGTHAFNFAVPKTTMPVKSYADPLVSVSTKRVTEFCWGISYNPALQDVMRVLDTLTTPPPDPSPVLGFWDKIRLILHWRAKVKFAGEVHLNLKGSRNPYDIKGSGAGFAFCWEGATEMLLNYTNADNELLQLTSDTMMIVIPEFRNRDSNWDEVDTSSPKSGNSDTTSSSNYRKGYKKVCANFLSGIRWGIGLILERTCEEHCLACGGLFACRSFDFKPHYQVQLEPKGINPRAKTLDDSFNGFRSDYIHLSTSLSSSVRANSPSISGPSNFYLSPKTFTHFWSWWELFDRFLSLPIRQGNHFPNARPPTPKFGQHLATIKYRFSIRRLFISHIYVDNSRETWSDGVTNFIGIKAFVDLFEADLHQREQEATDPGTGKISRHKPFYAAEVSLMGIQVRVVLAIFSDPIKRRITVDQTEGQGKYSFIRDNHSGSSPPKEWIDMRDYVEIDWTTEDDDPALIILPIASCPRFSYFRRTSGQAQGGDLRGISSEQSRFGHEDTHVCNMGKEPSLHHVQADLITARIAVLKSDLARLRHNNHATGDFNSSVELDDAHLEVQRLARDVQKKIKQLEQYMLQLRDTDDQHHHNIEASESYASYLMPSDIICPEDWTEFDNVYQLHELKVFLANSTRDILLQYYHSSRARRGFEYHMATRAVRFIRDQANAIFSPIGTNEKGKKYKKAASGAQIAANALKKMLIGDDEAVFRSTVLEDDSTFNPMDGWSEGVAVKKSHFCLLLKPQIVLRSDASTEAVCVLAALQATLQSFSILDTTNIADPVSGRIMTRTHAGLTGLQTFAPSAKCHVTPDGVPLEVLIDLRAGSDDFDRLVPQTDAIFRYDKFNRLRLRSNITSVGVDSTDKRNEHLQHQMDLVDIRVPKFTVTAGSKNFQAISSIITRLLLFSDAVHKQRSTAVETLLFKYDFTDLSSAAAVVEGFQSRLRRAVERERLLGNHLAYEEQVMRLEVLQTKAHVILLAEELSLIFEAIKLAQDKADENNADQKSALKLHASSSEISWGMVDDLRNMLVKLAVRGIDFSWLSRQDGSMVNKLHMGDVQAFDGSADAEWPEIISKVKDPSNHPLVKRGIFAQADWTVLAPVGGIAIYESFFLQLHPMRLQLEARVGKSVMEYVFPGRRVRKDSDASSNHVLERYEGSVSGHSNNGGLFHEALVSHSDPTLLQRSSVETPRSATRFSMEGTRPSLKTNVPVRITAARSFSDLRQASRQNSVQGRDGLPAYLMADKPMTAFEVSDFPSASAGEMVDFNELLRQKTQDDAAVMRSRSSQNTFVLVKISSMNLLLSFRKDKSFFCRDARIRTRELIIRNQTWSFEELANQFIPSEPTWRGWMKVALHQPLVPVLPVAKELFSKTKWMAGKGRIGKRQDKSSTDETSSNRSVSEPQARAPDIRIQSPPKGRFFKHLKKPSDATKDQDAS